MTGNACLVYIHVIHVPWYHIIDLSVIAHLKQTAVFVQTLSYCVSFTNETQASALNVHVSVFQRTLRQEFVTYTRQFCRESLENRWFLYFIILSISSLCLIGLNLSPFVGPSGAMQIPSRRTETFVGLISILCGQFPKTKHPCRKSA